MVLSRRHLRLFVFDAERGGHRSMDTRIEADPAIVERVLAGIK
jgi:hypothetical protein